MTIMNTKQDERASRIIGEQATQWVLDLRTATHAEQVEFTQWLKRSPEHAAEFLRATALWNDLREMGRGDTTDLEALAREVMASEANANVIPLNAAGPATTSIDAPRSKLVNTMAWRRIAAGVLVAVLATAWMGWRVYSGPTYATALGEQRTMQLADGSLMQLNTSSRVRVRFTAEYRDIQLLEGEAFFDVQHDASRPFRVSAGGTVVQAVGTQFNVYRAGDQTKVAVVEGRVRILEPEAAVEQQALPPTLIGAGEELSIAAGQPTIKRHKDEVVAAVAWRERKLVFSGKRLEDVAAEFNRYNKRRIVVADDAARDKLLSGTFNADDPNSLMLFLGTLDDVSVRSSPAEFVIARK